MQNSVRPFVVIVQFMCYKGFRGCCKSQEQLRWAKKDPKGSRFKKGQEGSRRFKKVQIHGPCKGLIYKKVQINGPCKQDSKGLRKVKAEEGSRRLKKVL